MAQLLSFVFLFLVAAAAVSCEANDETISMLLSGQARFLQQNNAYFLYNRNAGREPVRLLATAAGATGSSAHFRTKTVIVVHDRAASSASEFNVVLRDALLTAEDVSVLMLDWTWGALLPEEFASLVVPEVAAGLAEMIRLYIVGRRITAANLHIVGFGQGAHIAGLTARTLKATNANYEVARITGLDPAGGALWGSTSVRLTRSDAALVEVVHTDMAGQGSEDALGHLDFYVNGGINQPGCEIETECSHARAWEVFAASLTHALEGNKCSGEVPIEGNCRGFVVALGTNELVKFGNGLFYVDAPSDKYPYTSGGCLSICATTEETPDSTTNAPLTTLNEIATTNVN